MTPNFGKKRQATIRALIACGWTASSLDSPHCCIQSKLGWAWEGRRFD